MNYDWCPRHPYYIPPKSNYTCSVCKEGILNGEEYIVNDNGDYVHWECAGFGKDLARFLGYEIREMEDAITGDEWFN